VHAGKQAQYDSDPPAAGYRGSRIEREREREREREEKEMRFLFAFLLVLLFGCCEYRANDDIRIEIDEREPRETRHVRDSTVAEMLENAVQAYLEEDWDRCISAFNDALYG